MTLPGPRGRILYLLNINLAAMQTNSVSIGVNAAKKVAVRFLVKKILLRTLDFAGAQIAQ